MTPKGERNIYIVCLTHTRVNNPCAKAMDKNVGELQNNHMRESNVHAPGTPTAKSLGEAIRHLRKERKLTLEQLADAAGTVHGGLSKMERGKQGVTFDMLVRIAAGLGVSPVDLLALASDPAAQRELIVEGNMPIELFAKEGNIAPYAAAERGLVPLISWVSAGEMEEAIDIYAVGDAEEWVSCPVPHYGRNTFALTVSGDSMTAPYPGAKSYPNGCTIYVDPDQSPRPGQRVVAKNIEENSATFKVYVEDMGKKLLKPINPQYPIVEMTHKFIIIGVVIGSFLPE